VRTQRYVQWAGRGDVHFGRHISTVIDADAFALLEGNHGFGVQNSLLVAPFGGAARAMSTAPVCVGVPNGEDDHFILDFATSQIAEGKALVAMKSGKMAPADALIDGDGNPTGDPRALYGNIQAEDVGDPRNGTGALAAMGAHKGSGLGLACELLAGALTGSGAAGKADNIHNGMLSI